MAHFDKNGDLWIDVQHENIPDGVVKDSWLYPLLNSDGNAVAVTKVNITEYVRSIVRDEKERMHNVDGQSIMDAELRQ